VKISTILFTDRAVDAIVEECRAAAADGYETIWLSQIFAHDALALIGVLGREVPDVKFGTAVVPTYPRHPMVMAGSALTAQAATGNRVTLGIGLSHQVVIEGMWGYSFDKPARHMREYLSALMPLLRQEAVGFHGETLTAMGQMSVPGAEAPPVLLAALAPVMLKLAGGVADGTITWMTGPKTIETHIAPRINKAAAEAGRPAPRIVASLPVCVTDDPHGARESAAATFAVYGGLPSYRAMLDKEGAGGPADVAIVGDEKSVRSEIEGMFSAGVTEFTAAAFGEGGDATRTRDLLREMAAG
jgi:F420-dependent oxidoreductase-like protein